MKDKIKKILKQILTVMSIIGGIIISFFIGNKLNKEIKKWKKIKDKPDYVKVYDNEEEKWKEIKLPKNEKGEQIKSDQIKAIGISNGGKINVKIKSDITDRRNVNSLDDDTFTPFDIL